MASQANNKKFSILLLSMIIAAFASTTARALTPVPLATAGNYVILAQSGITTTGTTSIVGNLGLSPSSSTAITGFSLLLSSGGTYSTSSLVTGNIYAANYASPTPSTLTTAISDYTTAYNNAAGRLNPDFLDLGAGSLNGVTLTPGLYKWNSGLTLGGTITLSGNSAAVFILQIAGTLNFSPSSKIVLTGGVLSSNIFYQASGQVTIGGSAAAKGIILGKTGVVFNSGASLSTGRALAGTAVTLIANSVSHP